jgi:hypothetical protein
MSWDTLVYRVTTLAVIVAIAWLLFAPFPGHDPILSLVHQALIS